MLIFYIIHALILGNEASLGFNKQLVSLNIQAIVHQGEASFSEEYNFKVKLQSHEPWQREVNRRFHIFVTEHLMYSKVIDDLNEFQDSFGNDQFRINIPEMVYGKCTTTEFLIVMENLKTKGYNVVDKTKGLDSAHISLAVDQICRFHAVSYVYNKKEDLLEKYPCFLYNPDFHKFVGPITENCLLGILQLLEQKGREDLSKRLKESMEALLLKGTKYDEIGKGNALQSLIHGDFWNYNIMFQYEKNEYTNQEQVVNCKIIDWSNVVLGNPMFDLQYFIYTSTTRETRQKYLDDILHQYHDTFMKITTDLGFPPSDWSFQDFLKDWHKMDYIGFIFGILITSVTLSRKNPLTRPKEPSFLDHGIFFPLKLFAEYLKIWTSKVLVPITYRTTFGLESIRLSSKVMMKPINEEFLSGENEALTSRIFELLCEADERGLFSEPV